MPGPPLQGMKTAITLRNLRASASHEWFRRRSHLFGPMFGLAACLAVLPFVAGLLPIVHFVRERIDIAIYPEEVQVEGLYVYRNPWPVPVTQGLTIPLPVDEIHPEPTELAAWRLPPDVGPIALHTYLGQHNLTLPFRAHEEVQVVVRYRQSAPTRDARYLLLTTQPWGRPLDHALYMVAPHNVLLTKSNYPLHRDPQGVLGFERTDFMPPADWLLAWEVPK